MNLRKLELFVCQCTPCANFLDEVELATRGHYPLEVVHALQADAAERVRAYGIRLLPTLVIDGSHILEGVPAESQEGGGGYVDRMRALARPLPRRRQP